MITIKVGDILKSDAQTLVNTVNCVGVMGKGIALKFKERFPDMFEDYVERCRKGEVKLGQPYLYKGRLMPWILNFPTKEHWRSVSRIEDIVKGLDYLIEHYREWGITSLAVPPLGCGEGQLEWSIVGPTLYRYLKTLDIPIEMYAPHGTPGDELRHEFLDISLDRFEDSLLKQHTKRIDPGTLALVEILGRIECEPYHREIGRVMFQKIAYVATRLGIPTGLEYRRGSFGPFSPELKSLMTKLVNNGLIVEKRLGRMFAVKVGPTFEDARRVFQNDIVVWDSKIEKVKDLFMRMDTNRSEIVATVLYAASELEAEKRRKVSEDEILDAVLAWKQKRKPKLDKNDIACAIRNLACLGWLDILPGKDFQVSEDALI